MNRLCVLVVCFLMFGVCPLALGEKKAEEEATAMNMSVPQLASLGSEQRSRLVGQVYGARSSLQAGLISQLDPANPREVNCSIAFLLGLYRMEESPRHLLPYITLDAALVHNPREPLWDRYPVVEALIRIGSPAIPEMIKNIETSGDAKAREFSARVICGIDGPEIAKFRLQKAMEKQPDAAKKARLKAAIDGIKE